MTIDLLILFSEDKDFIQADDLVHDNSEDLMLCRRRNREAKYLGPNMRKGDWIYIHLYPMTMGATS